MARSVAPTHAPAIDALEQRILLSADPGALGVPAPFDLPNELAAMTAEASISGVVYNDEDGSGGRQDVGREKGFDGVPVTLYEDDGDGVAETTETILLSDSFEDPDAGDSDYELVTAFDDGSFEFFGRFQVDANGARDDFSGLDGSHFVIGQDHDGEGGPSTVFINFAQINNPPANVSLRGLFGALDSEPQFQNYEAGDKIEVQYSTDGGSNYTTFGRFANDGAAGDLFLDTNNDGVGDGARLTTTLSQFTFDITGLAASTLDVRIALTSDDSFEPLAVDNVEILGPGEDAQVDSTTTAGGGFYGFDNVPDGNYFVQVTAANSPVSGLSLTDGANPNGTVNVASAADVVDLDFGFNGAAPAQSGSVAGLLFNDINGNGAQDAGEPGVENAELSITLDGGDGVFGSTGGGGGSPKSDLDPGDIAIVGFNSDNPDDFAFVALTDIASGAEIRFTDNGWQAGGSFRSNEGTLVWTAPATVSAGDVVFYDGNADFTSAGGSFALSASGDQILAYQGSDVSPEFIYALNFNALGWSDATSSNTSALPTGLTNGDTAAAVGNADNGNYDGSTTSGDPATVRAAVSNETNWTTSGSRIDVNTWPTGYAITGGGSTDDTLIATLLTGFDGQYAFSELADGTYFVDVNEATLGAGFASNPTVPTPDDYRTVALSAAADVTGEVFGYVGPGNSSIEGRVFDDENADGDDESGADPGLEGVTVRLYNDDGNGSFNTSPTGSAFFTESFETAEGADPDWSLSNNFDDGFGDYFDRFETGDSFNDNRPVEYVFANADGDFFIGAQDLDGEGGAGVENLNITGVDITGKTDLRLALVLASEDPAGDGNNDFDDDDGLKIFANIDGAGETLIAEFANDGSQFNSELRLDTDGDGLGDGVALDPTFQDFTFPIPGVGASIDLRFEFAMDSGDEDLALDNVRLFDGGGTGDQVVATASTDANGDYSFGQLTPGTYHVQVVDSTDLFVERQITTAPGNPLTVASLLAGETRADVDAGYELLPGAAELTGFVFNDLDGDGIFDGAGNIFDPENATIAGVTVYLDLNDNDVFDSPDEPSVTTTSGFIFNEGAYSFTGLNAGAYTIRAELPADVRLNNPLQNDSEYVIEVGVGEVVSSDLDFAVQNEPDPTQISGIVFDDEGLKDGAYNPAEDVLLEGVPVELWADTDGNGSFNPGSTIFFSELHYDNAGVDELEGVEITGPAGLDLSGWQILGYNSNGGGTYAFHTIQTLAISGESNAQNPAGAYGSVFINLTDSATFGPVQNGAGDGLALVDPDGRLVEFISYEGTQTGGNGPARGVTSSDVGVSQGFGQQTTSDTIQRIGVGDRPSDFQWVLVEGGSSRGNLNVGLDLPESASIGDLLVGTRTTDENGAYSFGPELAPGDYHVNIDNADPPLAGAPLTGLVVQSDFTATLALAAEESKTVDYGFDVTPTPGSIGDLVWNDANANGSVDPGEAGIDGVDLSLTPVNAVLLEESFELDETDPGSNYSLSDPFDGAPAEIFDFFGRFSVDDNPARDDFSNLDGSNFIIGQDHDGQGGDKTRTISLENIDITGVTDLRVTALLGALASEPDFTNYEAGDGIVIEYAVDGGPLQTLGQFLNDGAPGDLLQDTDLDDTGDGVVLNAQLSEFAFDINGLAGNADLDLFFRLTSDDSFEPLAVDNVRVFDTSGASQTTTTSLGGLYEFTAVDAGTYFVDVDQSSAPLAGLPLTTADPLVVELLNGETFNGADFGFQGDSTEVVEGRVFNNIGALDPGIEGVDLDLFEDSNDNDALDLTTVATGDDTLAAAGTKLMLTGVFDGPLSGGLPKGVELYAIDDIPVGELDQYAVGSANNGSGTDGPEFQFPANDAVIPAGTYLYLATEADGFRTYFGFAPDYTDPFAVAINGDDAVELFNDPAAAFDGGQTLVDLFGEPTHAGTPAWDYADGWAYRTTVALPDGTYNAGQWDAANADALDNTTSNADAHNDGDANTLPVPIATFDSSRTDIQGVTLGDAFFGSATTDQTGAYQISGVPVGEYLLDVDQASPALAGFTLDTPGAEPVSLTKTVGVALTQDFGYTNPNAQAVSGNVFADLNNNQSLDSEPGLPGVTVDLFDDADGDGALDAFGPSTGTLANAAAPSKLLISAVFDGPLTGGQPKGLELYVLDAIAAGDLEQYAVGSANNGGGTDGPEFQFPANDAVIPAGSYLYLADDAQGFEDFFGFAPQYSDGFAVAVNGNDALELFNDAAADFDGGESLVDLFGDPNVDGAGEAWDYTDGWAARAAGVTAPSTTFLVGDWTFSGVDALDGESDNAAAASPIPVSTFGGGTGLEGDRPIGSTVTDANGDYLFSPLAPGDYIAMADDNTLPPNFKTVPDTGFAGSPNPVAAAVTSGSSVTADLGFQSTYFGDHALSGNVSRTGTGGVGGVPVLLFADNGANPGVAEYGGVYISEIHYANDGVDTDEFIEITGPAGTDLAGWSLALYNGSTGSVYDTIELFGTVADEGSGIGAEDFNAVGLQNGAPDGIALLSPGGIVVEFLSYEGAFTAADGPAAGYASSDIVVDQAVNAAADTLQRTGAGNTPSDLSWTGPAAGSRGSVNAGLAGLGALADADTLVASTPTSSLDADAGDYSFTNLADAAYLVDVNADARPLAESTLAAGSDPNAQTLAGADLNGVDFLYGAPVGTGSISSTVFQDLNGDGIQDASETGGVENATIYIDANENGAFDAGESFTTSASDGAYSLTGLLAGFYVVGIETPAGFRATLPVDGDQAVQVSPGEAVADDGLFGAEATRDATAVSGIVVNDSDGDGLLETGAPENEPGIDGAAVRLFQDDGDDAADLGTGVFINEFHYDNDGEDQGEFVELLGPAGASLDGWRLEFYEGDGGFVYAAIDLTGQSIPGSGGASAGFLGVQPVDFDIRNGGTNGDGFALVNPDGNVVEFLSYEGAFTAANGAARGLTSTDVGVAEDASTALGESIQRTGPGAFAPDFNWASPAPNTSDLPNNAQTVAFLAGGDQLIAVATTADGGQYSFDGTTDGPEPGLDYFVQVDLDPAGSPFDTFGLTSPAANPVLVPLPAAGDTPVQDFGFSEAASPLGSIAGVKFEDYDGDGLQDPGEPGLADVTIFIDDDNDGFLDGGESFTSTAGDGSYSFTGLADGLYTVAEVLDDESTPTVPAAGAQDVELDPGENQTGVDFGNRKIDFGDAPDSADTLLLSNGARHVIVPGAPILGPIVDGEIDGQPTPDAIGDDTLDANDDEDGVTFGSVVAGSTGSVDVQVTGSAGVLDAWIDFNDDGDFNDPGEQVFTNTPVSTGVNALNFAAPLGSVIGEDLLSRFRVATADGDVVGPDGLAPNGEVEDHTLTVDATAPVVTDLLVRSTGWAPQFTTHLTNQGLADADGFYRVPTTAGQLDVLPWTGVDEIRLRFSEPVDVDEAGFSDFQLTGVNNAAVDPTAVVGDGSATVTWSLPALTHDKYLVNADDAIVSLATGLALDGEYADNGDLQGANSGDGAAGGDFEFRFDLLPGDVNRDAGVNFGDISAIQPIFGDKPGDASYDPFADINGSAFIEFGDIAALSARFNDSLPAGAPTANAAGAIEGPALEGDPGDDATLDALATPLLQADADSAEDDADDDADGGLVDLLA